MEAGGFGMLEATDAGLREGVFFESLLGEPPLVPDVRDATVRNLAAQFHTDFAHADHVARLSLELWDGLAAAGVHRGDPRERELLWATAMLHDIGTAVDYDDHHKHSRYLILSAGLPGFSPRETALIGQAARYHRKGTPGMGEFSSLAREGDEELLNRITASVRIAEQLERSRDQAVRAFDVDVRNGNVEPAPGRRRGRDDRSLGDRAPGRRLPPRLRPRALRLVTASRPSRGRQVAGRLVTRCGVARLDPRDPPCFWSSEDSAPPSVPATGGPVFIGAAGEGRGPQPRGCP